MLGEFSPKLRAVPVAPLVAAPPTSLCDYGRRFITGQSLYYWLNPNRLTSATSALTSGNIYTAPTIISNQITINLIGTVITTNATTNGVLRFGIYADTGSVFPGNLIVDAGTVLADSGATVGKSVTLASPLVLSPGLYWFACGAQVAAGPVISQMNALSDVHFPHASPPALTSEQRTTYFLTGISSSLPLVWSGTTANFASIAPCMYIQVV